MQLSDVKLAHEYLENLKRLKLLVNIPSSAELPHNLLKALSDLCPDALRISSTFNPLSTLLVIIVLRAV